jgi:hypothetical protein
VRVRLGARRLDRRLAAGTDPDATPELRARADELTEAKERCHLAAVLDRIRREAEGSRRPFESASPLARDAIQGCASEIEGIVDCLTGGAALGPQGTAMVAVLVRDVGSPLLHRDTSETELRQGLDSITRELGPRPT